MKVFVIENNYGEDVEEDNLQAGSESGCDSESWSESKADKGIGNIAGSQGEFRCKSKGKGKFRSGCEGVVKDPNISWYFIADSAVTNTGKPFYVPEGKGKVTVSMGPAVKISRLGKSISEKFSDRYYEEFGPALHFKLPDYKRELQERGLSTDASINFDKSLVVGRMLPINEMKGLCLYKNGEKVASWKTQNSKFSLGEVIQEISLMNTLKMGDLILPGLSEEIEIKEGDKLEVMLNDIQAFQVKVK